MCAVFIARTPELLLEHISRVHSQSANFQTTCIIKGCQRTYHNYGAFRRHLRHTHNYYSRSSNTETIIPCTHCEEEYPINSDEDNSECDIEPPTKKQRAEWILKIKETNKLTQSCTENILQDVTHLCSSIIADLTTVVKRKLAPYNTVPGLEENIISIFQNDSYSNPFKGLETHYKQIQYLRECFNFVVRLVHTYTVNKFSNCSIRHNHTSDGNTKF